MAGAVRGPGQRRTLIKAGKANGGRWGWPQGPRLLGGLCLYFLWLLQHPRALPSPTRACSSFSVAPGREAEPSGHTCGSVGLRVPDSPVEWAHGGLSQVLAQELLKVIDTNRLSRSHAWPRAAQSPQHGSSGLLCPKERRGGKGHKVLLLAIWPRCP